MDHAGDNPREGCDGGGEGEVCSLLLLLPAQQTIDDAVEVPRSTDNLSPFCDASDPNDDNSNAVSSLISTFLSFFNFFGSVLAKDAPTKGVDDNSSSGSPTTTPTKSVSDAGDAATTVADISKAALDDGPAPGCSPPPGVPANVVVSSTFETPVQPSYNAGAGQENSSTKAVLLLQTAPVDVVASPNKTTPVEPSTEVEAIQQDSSPKKDAVEPENVPKNVAASPKQTVEPPPIVEAVQQDSSPNKDVVLPQTPPAKVVASPSKTTPAKPSPKATTAQPNSSTKEKNAVVPQNVPKNVVASPGKPTPAKSSPKATTAQPNGSSTKKNAVVPQNVSKNVVASPKQTVKPSPVQQQNGSTKKLTVSIPETVPSNVVANLKNKLQQQQQSKAKSSPKNKPTKVVIPRAILNSISQLPETSRIMGVFLSLNITTIYEREACDQPDFNSNMSIYFPANKYKRQSRSLPITYKGGEDYRTSLLPYMLFDVWAQFAQEAINQGADARKPIPFTVTNWNKDFPAEIFNYISVQSVDVVGNVQDERYKVGSYLAIMQCTRPWLVFISWREFTDPKKDFKPRRMICGIKMSPEAWQDAYNYYPKSRILSIRPIIYIMTTLRMIDTLDWLVKEPEFFSKIHVPCLETCRLDTGGTKYELFERDKFNGKQTQAIVACLNSLQQSGPKIQLIQGPPGTGKTHTLVGLVKNIFHQFAAKGVPTRVLICAPSNGAVDNIAIKLLADRDKFEQILGRPVRMVRQGHSPKISPHVIDIHWRTLKDKKRLDIPKTDIVLSTLGGCQSFPLGDYLGLLFNCVIIDESAQCSEPELLLPFAYDVSHKMILIGDPKQLPATVICREAEKVKYGRSMFERFVMHFEAQGKGKTAVMMLNTQFRMKPPLIQWPSKRFYNNQLQTMLDSGLNPFIPLQPLLVFNVEDSAEATNNMSKMNQLEAMFIQKLLVAIVTQAGFPDFVAAHQRYPLMNAKEQEIFHRNMSHVFHRRLPFSIGIITFYNEQKKVLKNMIKFPDSIQARITIDTVDGFQGREEDIIILSCVRTENVGFVRSEQRLNVALTRAKSALYVCLNDQPFQADPLWRSLLSNAQQRKLVRTVSHGTEIPTLQGLLV